MQSTIFNAGSLQRLLAQVTTTSQTLTGHCQVFCTLWETGELSSSGENGSRVATLYVHV